MYIYYNSYNDGFEAKLSFSNRTGETRQEYTQISVKGSYNFFLENLKCDLLANTSDF